MDSSSDCFAQVRDLTVTYTPEDAEPIRALDGVSIEVRSGEIVGILGESGCGKSTLASALLRLLAPHAKCQGGTIQFCGRDLLKLPEREVRAIRGREISLIPQDPALSLNPVMTAGSQVGEVLRAHLPLTAQQRRERVMELLREVGFDHPEEIYSAYPHQLSGGQRQRIAIAQAVACRPALLIADEPTSKLDATLQAEILALLSQIRRQHRTAILVMLQNLLVSGYDFTRNTNGGSEKSDVSTSPDLSQAQTAEVNQRTVAVLDQRTVAVLDGSQYSAFGHGTMTAGIVHLVAPQAKIMPLKSFNANGTGYDSDILRAIYYAVKNGAKVLNMSFDYSSYSPELANAIEIRE